MTIASRIPPIMRVPVLLAVLLAPAAAAPARAQAPEGLGIETVLGVLGEVLRGQGATGGEDDELAAAGEELDEDLYHLERERTRIVEDFERRRWEEDRRFQAEMDETRWRHGRKGHQRRGEARALSQEHEDQLRRLDSQERRRLAELDRRVAQAERRYDDRTRTINGTSGGGGLGDLLRTIDLGQAR